MKFQFVLFIPLLALFGNVHSQNLDYDIQSCFNENETVQAALYKTLMSEGRIDALNSMLEIPMTEADVDNLRPLSSANSLDVELCNYYQSLYTETTWVSIGTVYLSYFYRANDFFFVVNPRIPKDISDPNFALAEDTYWIFYVADFDPESGFEFTSINTGLKYHPGMVLPESGN